MIGLRIGPYRVIAKIGEGGMGEVYRASDERLGRDVAIKILPLRLATDPERLTRFEREARILGALNHPHIGAIYGLEDVDGVPTLVLELIDGETLAEELGRGPLPLMRALTIARQIAEALEAAHERGIVHRDLKPANIKVTPAGFVKVLDFGLAKLAASDAGSADAALSNAPTALTEHTDEGRILGTVAYMSPEQAAGQTADKRSDMWSFGVVLLELLTARSVFAGQTPSHVLAAVLTTEPDWTRLPVETPIGIRKLLQRCLEKEHARRLDSAAAARLEIDDALAATASHTPTTHPHRRSKVPAVMAALVLLIVAGVLWQLRQRDYFWRNPLTDAKVERLTDFEGDEVDAAISPDGKFTVFLSDRDGPLDVWVSQIDSGEFVNITRGDPRLAFNGGIRYTGFSGDGAQIWFQRLGVQPGRNDSWLAPTVGGVPRPFVNGGMNPMWLPDGKTLAYHTNEPGDPIFIADRNGSSPRRIFRSEPSVHNHYPTLSPDGRFIYMVSGSPQTEDMDIWRLPVPLSGEATTPERITFHNARVAYPAWLDERTLIYSATADDGSGQWLYAMDVERRIPHRVSSGISDQYLSVAVSATRPRRVVSTIAVPTANLWSVPITGDVQGETAVTPITVPNARAHGPRVAPGYLTFLSSKGGADGLWKLEAGAARELWSGDEGGVVAPPAISPDGRLIAFSYRKQGVAGLYVMNANGTSIRALMNTFNVRGAASWSPDGKWIAVAATQDDATRLFKVPVDGGEAVRLLDTVAYNPVWSPNGKTIVYSEQQGGGAFEVKAMTPDGAPVALPAFRVGYTISTPYRFVPDGRALIALEGNLRAQNFFVIDLESGLRRQLTDFKAGSMIHNFDVSPDGRQLVFDRHRDNSDVVVMNLVR